MSTFSNATLLHEYRDEHGAVSVYENSQYRWIQTASGSIQSAMNKAATSIPVLPYFPAMLASLLFVPEPRRILVVGLGGGELIRFFNHSYPGVEIFAIERSHAMIHAYQSYFQQNIAPIPIIADDICQYIPSEDPSFFNIIFLDVFSENGLPSCLSSPVVYERLARQMPDDGVLAINLAVKNEQQAMNLLKVVRQAFHSNTVCLAVGKHLNLVILAFKQAPSINTLNQLQENAGHINQSADIDFMKIIDNLFMTNPNNGERLVFN